MGLRGLLPARHRPSCLWRVPGQTSRPERIQDWHGLGETWFGCRWGQIISTAIIGTIVAWIAWRQWKTAHEKVKLDLFDRRFAVFMDVREIVSQGGMRDRLSDQGLPNEVVARGRFLFGPEILKQLEELHNICCSSR